MENKEKKEIKNTENKYSKVKKITIPDDSSIPVTSLFCGKLTYISKKDGSTYEWNEFGETVDIEFRELKIMLSNQKRFFIDNWITMDREVIEALKAERYYPKHIEFEDLANIAEKSDKEIEEILTGISNSMKYVIGHMIIQKVKTGEIDSRKKIVLLEKILGYDLT